MKKNKLHIKTLKVLLLGTLISVTSCIEDYNLSTEGFEDLLVVEATITNKVSTQEVKLSRTFKLESDEPVGEAGAQVRLRNEFEETYEFSEASDGIYKSQLPFAAQANVKYTLEIITNDGRMYKSSYSQFKQATEIDEVSLESGINENGEAGVSILISTQDLDQEKQFYRYQYEETYKIIAPLYSPKELIINNEDFPYPNGFFAGFTIQEITDFLVSLESREEQQQVCYKTDYSTEIILKEGLNESGGLLNERLLFISKNNLKIAHRFSFMVNQFRISEEAYYYYDYLSRISTHDDLFSEVQAGFLEGNIKNVNNSDEKVLGYFQVAPIDSKRIFFNYQDVFPGEILSGYFISCDEGIMPVLLEEDFAHNITNSPLIDALKQDFKYYADNEDSNGDVFEFKPFVLVIRPCGDCTVYGSNQIPDFWIE